jgi:hypothetical protein
VKVNATPWVYGKFLAAMENFKTGVVDTAAVISRVGHLFSGLDDGLRRLPTCKGPGGEGPGGRFCDRRAFAFQQEGPLVHLLAASLHYSDGQDVHTRSSDTTADVKTKVHEKELYKEPLWKFRLESLWKTSE